MNQTVEQVLRSYIIDQPQDWDMYMANAMEAINTLVQDALTSTLMN
jgi:hypothetical protein